MELTLPAPGEAAEGGPAPDAFGAAAEPLKD